MNILDNLYEMNFKDIAKEFNAFAQSVLTTDSVDATSIRRTIFNEIQKKYPTLKIREVDYHYRKFRFEIDYEKDFQGLKQYDKGSITLSFSIRTKRTDKLEEVSKTKKQYVNTKHKDPIAFSGYSIYSRIPIFEWATNDPKDLRIKVGGHHSNDEMKHLEKKQNIQEVLDIIPSTYLPTYRLGIVQPIAKTLFMSFPGSETYENIRNGLPSNIIEAMDNKVDWFGMLADYIIEEELVTTTL